MAGPLNGLKVLDFTTLLPGPFATLALADMGAEVLCIKAPDRAEIDALSKIGSAGGNRGPLEVWLGRGKRSMRLNLKHPQGRRVVERLLETHDILVEQFRPGVMERLGLSWNELRERFPHLIYCSLTGYGQEGPLSQRAGHDINYLARSGLMGHSGRREHGPALTGMQIADVAAGSHGVVISILAAAIHRMNTGQGQHLDVSMTDGSMVFNAMAAAQYLSSGKEEGRETWQLNGGSLYDFYECADGGYISFGGLEPKFCAAFMQTIGLPELIPGGLMPADLDRAKSLVAGRIKEKTRDEWAELFSKVDACAEPVLSLAEALDGEHAKARGLVREIARPDGGTVRQLGLPLKFSATPPNYGKAGGATGAHTKEVMTVLGYSEAEIEELGKDGLFG